MDTTRSLIGNVSDTARWVAANRAAETRRLDALFHDELAERLSGPRGYAIAQAAPRLTRNGWWLISRTKIIDDMIAAALAEGCDRIVNLAAGFDTRPYRLDLPADLTWVEADLPALIEEKNVLLVAQTPRCRLQRRGVDLSDAAQRWEFLTHALDGAVKPLVITEGLIIYLDDHDVRGLARDLRDRQIGWWITDFPNARMLTLMRSSTNELLASTPFVFGPRSGAKFFPPLGWDFLESESVLRAAHRFHRLPAALRPFGVLPHRHPERSRSVPVSVIARMTLRSG